MLRTGVLGLALATLRRELAVFDYERTEVTGHMEAEAGFEPWPASWLRPLQNF